MTEEQAKALKVGDKVRFIGEDFSKNRGVVYEITGIDEDGDPYVEHCDFDGQYIIFNEYCEDFELAEASMPNYQIEFVDTGADFDGTGMVRIAAYVNDDLLAHLRDIEAEQGREAKRKAIREQIAKLEADSEAI